MGMFDKDKQMGLILQQHKANKEEFVLWGVRIAPELVTTKFGPAEQTILTISDTPTGTPYDVTTLASAIASKSKEAEPDEFPAVVYWTLVDTSTQKDVCILRFVRPVNTPRTDSTPAPSGAMQPGQQETPTA